ncbi:hypothetical protein EVAR_66294_1 [Eumeta japonica]|uniref:Uncharacterized protein n=1 Tax=Eumeta variegata TaxID=151549 RepID=A0A4C1YTG1_EUMVA|nr:hypothetical protein EVAR_66294_1 [Eumeta japonica]
MIGDDEMWRTFVSDRMMRYAYIVHSMQRRNYSALLLRFCIRIVIAADAKLCHRDNDGSQNFILNNMTFVRDPHKVPNTDSSAPASSVPPLAP